MKTRSIIARGTFRIVKFIYFLIGVGVAVPFTIVLLTDGTLRMNLIEYAPFGMLLVIILVFFTYIGLHHFFFVDDLYVFSIQSKCILLGEYNSRFNAKIELPRDHIISYYEHHYLFGLKKELCLVFIANSSEKRQRFNISMLSKVELNLLRRYLDDVVNAANSKQ